MDIPEFRIGSVVRLASGLPVMIEEVIDQETYRVITPEIQTIQGHPCNRFIAKVVPMLVITGVSP